MESLRIMRDLNKLDPDIRRFVEMMREEWKNYPPLETLSFPEQRAAAQKAREPWSSGGPEMAETEDFVFDAGAGELGLRIHRPRPRGGTALTPVMVYIHGGGFTLFSNATHDRLMREYAALGGFTVIGIDYPLAPETRYPAALDRIEALMLWLGDNAAQWRLDPGRIAMAGDSAGGNLSFATCLRLRERGRLDLVRCILSNYGGFSCDISDEAEARFGGPGSIMDRAEAEGYWRNYLRGAEDRNDPQACPLLADLTGFPPVFLVIPELDLVAEHSFAMTQKLVAARVETTAAVYPGATHSFLEAMSISPLARRAIAAGASFTASHLSA